jgi:hypothetical protein
MKVRRRTCAIEPTSWARICYVNMVINHHSASSAREDLSLALDREVVTCSLIKTSGWLCRNHVCFLS